MNGYSVSVFYKLGYNYALSLLTEVRLFYLFNQNILVRKIYLFHIYNDGLAPLVLFLEGFGLCCCSSGTQGTPKRPNAFRNRFTQTDHKSTHRCLSRG